jgi:hypothetical protein
MRRLGFSSEYAWPFAKCAISHIQYLIENSGEKRNAYKILVGKPEGKRPLGRPRHRWVDNIKMDLREIGWD